MVLQRQADAGGLDLAFRANEPATEAPLSDHELRRLPLVLYPRHSPIYRSFAPLIAAEDDGDEAGPRHFCDSQITIEQMLLAGFGVSALILARVQNSLKSGELIRVPTHTPVPSLDITATHLNRARRKYCFQLLDLARQAAGTWARDFDDVVSIQPALARRHSGGGAALGPTLPQPLSVLPHPVRSGHEATVLRGLNTCTCILIPTKLVVDLQATPRMGAANHT